LLPDIDWNKGKALLWLLETLELERGKALPIFIGDDRTDEDAFSALQSTGIGILVSEQLQPTAAKYSLMNPTQVERFLRALVAKLM
jgi:trehalose-phosphatase